MRVNRVVVTGEGKGCVCVVCLCGVAGAKLCVLALISVVIHTDNIGHCCG